MVKEYLKKCLNLLEDSRIQAEADHTLVSKEFLLNSHIYRLEEMWTSGLRCSVQEECFLLGWEMKMWQTANMEVRNFKQKYEYF